VIVVVLPGYLGEIVGGRGRVSLPGAPASVGEALAALVGVHPRLRDRIQDEQGVVRTHVNVFVGGVSIRETGGLATPLGPDAEIRVLPAVSGG
jgi:molybdopterin converting factor small subunit